MAERKVHLTPAGSFIQRTATEADAEGIANIYNYYVKQGGVTYTNAKERNPRQFYKKLQQSSLWIHVLERESDGMIVGWSAWIQLGNFDNVASRVGYAHPDYVNGTIGTLSWEYADEAAKYFGWDSYIINIEHTNTLSLEFHKKLGFKVIGTIKDVKVKGGKKVDQVWLQRMVDR